MNSPLSNRRRFLRGLGACLSLPSFEALTPPARAASAPPPPQRLAFIYFPNGAIHQPWWPTGADRQFSLGPTLAPLQNLQHYLQVVSGFAHKNAEAGNDGAGDHARANGTFLTGVRVKKTAGSDIAAAISVDQIAAQHLAPHTRFPSLELSTDPHRKSGGCDSGYSCAYESGLAWRSPSSPLSPESNPRLVFERLFGSGPPGARAANLARRRTQQKSILDFVRDDAQTLQRQLSHRDLAKLDEYLTGLRQVEQRIENAERFPQTPDPPQDSPSGIPAAYDQYIRLMFEMLALSFETDSTRVASLLLAHDGSNRSFPEIGIPEGHHSLSHHQNNPDMIAKVARIDRFYIEQLAAFLTLLESKKEADGQSLLHHSTIVYGCGNSDGNRHTHTNLPILVAGGGSGKLHPGRFLRLPETPLCNLYLTLLDHLGVPHLDRFGDSTARLADI